VVKICEIMQVRWVYVARRKDRVAERGKWDHATDLTIFNDVPATIASAIEISVWNLGSYMDAPITFCMYS